MSYRDDVDALAARHAALDAQAAEATRQRDDAARLLAEARARAKLPILDNVRVASPCSEQWANMVGDDRVRVCAKCTTKVYNLSAMTREEAEALIVARAGNLCARYYQRADGTILTSDCLVGVRAKRRRRWVAAAIGASASLGAAFGVYKVTRHHEDEDIREIAGGLQPIPQAFDAPAVVDPPVIQPAPPRPQQESVSPAHRKAARPAEAR